MPLNKEMNPYEFWRFKTFEMPHMIKTKHYSLNKIIYTQTSGFQAFFIPPHIYIYVCVCVYVCVYVLCVQRRVIDMYIYVYFFSRFFSCSKL